MQKVGEDNDRLTMIKIWRHHSTGRQEHNAQGVGSISMVSINFEVDWLVYSLIYGVRSRKCMNSRCFANALLEWNEAVGCATRSDSDDFPFRIILQSFDWFAQDA